MYFFQKTMHIGIFLFIIHFICVTTAPTTSAAEDQSNNPDPSLAHDILYLETRIKADLDNIRTRTDFTLAVRAQNGRTFIHSTNNADAYTVYESASTSKMVAAVIILSVVKDGMLSLDDHPQDHITQWPTYGNLSAIKLRHLLSLTSGLAAAPLCFVKPDADFETCAVSSADSNRGCGLPGKEFYYSTTNLQVAGLMAVNASGLLTWENLFQRFQAETGLFPTGKFDVPSLENPRLAAGMHWNIIEYLDFLKAIYNQEILTPELIDQMTHDQLGNALPGSFPIPIISWHYGFGCWIECCTIQNNCSQRTRISSPGIFGSYPFIDFEHKFYGIIAQDSESRSSRRGYTLYSKVANKLEEWALMNLE